MDSSVCTGCGDLPQKVRDRIAADIREVVGDPQIELKLSATGQVVNPGTPAGLRRRLKTRVQP